jgi:S-adenosylmethionine:tRNA ribosyltransferase-isomerase
MHIKEFDYDLPPELIAQYPVEKRDHSRLMVLHRKSKAIEHRSFFHITDYLKKGDVLVLNDAKVIPARLAGRKESGGTAEVFLLKHLANGSPCESTWHCLVNTSKRPKINSKIFFDQSLTAEVMVEEEEGFTITFTGEGNVEDILERIGITPLPPYIKRCNGSEGGHSDRDRYQTVFARSKGAVAAPTAGLHFTKELLDQIAQKGVKVVFLTLQVGWGTFQPVRAERIEEHRMYTEDYALHSSTAQVLNEAQRRGGRIIGVGTTTTRLLESVVSANGTVKPGRGSTDLFIYPGYSFKAIDCLITNFHLPQSTLVMLVAAFAGRECILNAYHEAIQAGYRFYSYGDAMMIM